MPPKAPKCEACGKFVSIAELMSCLSCTRTYHHLCLNVLAKDYKKLPADNRKVDKCDSCKSEQRSQTPLRAPSTTSHLNQDGLKDSAPPLQTSAAASAAAAAVVAATAKLATFEVSSPVSPNTPQPNVTADDKPVSSGNSTFDITSLETRLEALIHKGNETLKKEIRLIIESEIKKQVTSLTARFEARLIEVEKHSEKIAVLENNLLASEKRVTELEYQFGSHQQWLRMSNLEVSGVPELKNESPRDITIKIAAHAGVVLKPEDIEFAHRVQPMKAKPGRPKVIITKLRNRSHKDAIVAGLIKTKGIKTSDIGFSGDEQKLYVHDHLTPSNKKMFMDLKEICNKHNYTYVWTKHCNVYARKADNCPLIHIRTPVDFHKIV